ncbi:Crp/Fnr family transcriptional regulator [Streptomyces gobiensis]|uniref:Crp/Fnr family transcriptional regulator n=1 Tax=Streptomyces gobiensis TaxID=2875706 RepID=UPI001E2B88DB|nr:Crp/Fnr family transcriptional regulator [Streptomyces gobiensis]UGY94761.1 Crp/Fnr family transcriptional regulator [Streptomyces gobiensis]
MDPRGKTGGKTGGRPPPAALRAAAWVMRCLGGCWPPGEQEAAELAARLEQRLLAPGQLAFGQGRIPEGVWIVRSGTLELVSGTGRHRVVVGVVQPCGVVGDVPLLLGRPAVCTVRALTDVQAGFLPATAFHAVLESSPALARAWLSGLARRHAGAQESLAQSVGGTAERRVARLLLREARDGTVACSQGTLAAMLGLRRPTLNRVLKDFERAGLLRVGYRQVELLATDQLQRRAGDSG